MFLLSSPVPTDLPVSGPQASAVTAHVLRVAGAPTAQCPAAVRMEVPVLQRTEAASVPLVSEDPYVREVRLGPRPNQGLLISHLPFPPSQK